MLLVLGDYRITVGDYVGNGNVEIDMKYYLFNSLIQRLMQEC